MRVCSLALFVFLLGACRDPGIKNKPNEPPPAEATCGDGHVDTGEDCDGSDLAMASCISLGFDTGTLTCGTDCKFATGLCVKRCGNGQLDPGETCDGRLGLTACTSFGYMACSTACQIDQSHCVNDPLNDGPTFTRAMGGASALGDLSPRGPGDLVMVSPARGRIDLFPWSPQLGFSEAGLRSLSFFKDPRVVAVGELTGDSSNDLAAINEDGTLDVYAFTGSGFSPSAIADAGCDGGAFLGPAVLAVDAGAHSLALSCGGPSLLISQGNSRVVPTDSPLVAAGDVTADGLTDFVTLSTSGALTATIFAAPAFTAGAALPLTGTATGLAVGDLDADGDADLVTVTPTGLTIYEYVNAAWAEKTQVVTAHPLSLAIADFDLDGLGDLFYASGDDVIIRRNRGGFVFSEFRRSAGFGPRLSTSWGDVDGDGDLDVAVTVSTGDDSTRTSIVNNRVR